MKPLPPYGKRFIEELPTAGLWVSVGPRAWDIAQAKPFPVLVLPPGKSPRDFRWPRTPAPALIFETGAMNDELLKELATAIMLAGAPSVVAIREARLRKRDCCTYFEAIADDGC